MKIHFPQLSIRARIGTNIIRDSWNAIDSQLTPRRDSHEPILNPRARAAVLYRIRKLMKCIKRLIAPRKCENSGVLPSAAYSVPRARTSNSASARFANLVEFHNASGTRGKVLPCFFAPDRSNSFSPANIMRVRKIGDLWGDAKRRRRFQMRRYQEVAEDSPLARLNSLILLDEKREKERKANETKKL